MAERRSKAPPKGTYKGIILRSGSTEVTFNGRRLAMRLHEVNHSPTGFAWGYGGSGPAQLAYAILRHHLGNREDAKSAYQRFKFEVVAVFHRDANWEITSEEVAGTGAVRDVLARKIMEG